MMALVHPVSLNVKYTAEDCLRMARFIQNRSFLYRYDALLTFLVVMVLFTLIIVFMASELTIWVLIGGLIWAILPAAVLGFVVFLLHGPIGQWLARRRVEKYLHSSPLAQEEANIEFSGEQIRITSDLASSVTKWEAITSILRSPTDIMFFTGKETFGWFIPIAAFRSLADFTALDEHLRNRFGENFVT